MNISEVCEDNSDPEARWPEGALLWSLKRGTESAVDSVGVVDGENLVGAVICLVGFLS